MNRRFLLGLSAIAAALVSKEAKAQFSSSVLPVTVPANANVNLVGMLAYYSATPSAATIVPIPDNYGLCFLQGSTVLASLIVRLPPTPQDMQICRISSQMAITLLTVQNGLGVAIGSPFALGALGNGSVWQYQSTAWQRIG